MVVRLLGWSAAPVRLFPPPRLPQLPTWDWEPLVVSGRGWVPGSGPGWGCCGCWPWPSPAAGGRPAARVRRCGAASAAPRPETLRASASATSSSMVGAGAGSGMKAAGIPRAAPPAGAGIPVPSGQAGTFTQLTWTLSVAHSPPRTAVQRTRGRRLMRPLLLLLPTPRLAPSPRLGIVFCTSKSVSPTLPHKRSKMARLLHYSRSFPQRSISCSLLAQPDDRHLRQCNCV